MKQYTKASYLEHTAVYVKDIKWHINFFKEVFGMPIRYLVGTEEQPEQVWLLGGVQLVEDLGYDSPEGRLTHLGVMTEDLQECLDAAYERNVVPIPGGKGRNFIQLPDGLRIEVMQADDGAVKQYVDSIDLMGCYDPHNPNPKDNVPAV